MQSGFLYRGLERRGHQARFIGPDSLTRVFAESPKVDVLHSQAASQIIHYGLWAGGHALVLGIAHTATRLGAARTGAALQHTADMHTEQQRIAQNSEVEDRPELLEATRR